MRLATLALFVAALSAQQPTFRAGTTLIEFSIVALDDRGSPVTDLRKEEIILTEQGQAREVAFFRFDGAPEPLGPRVLPAGVFTNRFDTSPNPARHVTAIVVDVINTPTVHETMLFTQASMRNQITKYLDALPPHTRVGLYTIGPQVQMHHDFTEDVASLRAQVAKIQLARVEKFPQPGYRDSDNELDPLFTSNPQSPITAGSPEAAAQRATMLADERKALAALHANVRDRRLTMTLAGLEAIGNHLAGIPGRKNIVWVGGGMVIKDRPAGSPGSYADRMRRVAERLATQGIAIYPVSSLASVSDVRSSLDLFADVTGGRVTLTMNNPVEGLETTARDQRGVYSIGFYPVAAPDNKWHPLDVRVTRRGVKVTHRRGYLAQAASPQPLEWAEAEWRVALGNPLGSSAVRLDGRFEPVASAERTFDLQLQIFLKDLHFRDSNGKWLADVEIATAEKIANGDFAFRVERATLGRPASAVAEALGHYTRRLVVNPNIRSLRVIVRDRMTGKHGAVDIPIAPR